MMFFNYTTKIHLFYDISKFLINFFQKNDFFRNFVNRIRKKIIRNHMTSDDNHYQILFLNMTDYRNYEKNICCPIHDYRMKI